MNLTLATSEVRDMAGSYVLTEAGNEAAPAGYKRTEVGVIPEDWHVQELADLKPFITSGSRGWADYYSNHGSAFIRITNMSRDSIYLDLDDLKLVNLPPDSTEGVRTQLQDGDLLVSITADIGIIAFVDPSVPKPAYINQHIALVRLDAEKADSKFLSYFLAGESSQKAFRAGTDRGAKAGMNLRGVREIKAAFPPLVEQSAIAAALSGVDALLAKLDQLIAKKRDLKQAAMQQLLTGRIRLQGFEGQWATATYGALFDFLPTATNSRADLSENQGDTLYIHYGDIHTRFRSHLNFGTAVVPRIDKARCKNAASLQNGDWIMVDASEDFVGVGKAVEVCELLGGQMAVAGLHTFLLREKAQSFAPGFKGHLGGLESLHQDFLRVATGMKVYGVSKMALKEIRLPVPSLPEQTAIATILSDMDTELAALETRRDKTRELKQGMMQALLTGRIRLA